MVVLQWIEKRIRVGCHHGPFGSKIGGADLSISDGGYGARRENYLSGCLFLRAAPFGDPGRDLGAGAEAQLDQDVLDMPSAVRWAMTRRSAISLLDSPAATRAATSCSRAVSCGSAAGSVPLAAVFSPSA
jgi:hypothetical protein